MSKVCSKCLYLTGKVRALEKKLFDAARFSRLSENNHIKSLLNDLADSNYQNFIHEDFEKGLANFVYFHYDYFRKIMDDPAVLDIFMINNDILNYIGHLRKFKKSEFYGPGVLKYDWYKEKILPGFFFKVEERLKKLLGSKELNNASDAMIEAVCLEILQKEYVDYIAPGRILSYWKYAIDIKNLLKKVNSPQTGYYFCGGHIKTGYWVETVIGEDLPPKIRIQPYAKLISEEGSRMNWENILRRWQGKVIKEMRKITFGAEPVVSYLLSIIEETINLKMIYAGIQMGFSSIEIKEKLNLSYV